MTDIAELAIKASPRELQLAVIQLEKLSVEAGKAEVAAKKLEKQNASAALAIATANKQAATEANRLAQANKNLSAADRQAAAEGARVAQAAYQAAKGADLQATATLKAAQAALANSEAAQKLVQANNNAADSAQNLANANDRTMRNMGRLAGQQQANMTNIAAQFQDIGVTAAMGMNPLMIGLQQGAQLTGVWGSIAGTTAQKIKTFGASLMAVLSPMSLVIIALTAGIAYLIQWATEALSAKDATNSLSDANSALSAMQSSLGEMFDMTSGKIKNNSEMIRVNTLMTILNAQAKAKALAVESKDILGRAAEGNAPNLGLFSSGFGLLMSGPEQAQQTKNLRALQKFTKDYSAGVMKAEDAILAAGRLDLRGTGFTATQLREAIQGSVTSKALEQMASDAMQSLESGTLNPSLRRPEAARSRRAAKGEPTQGEKFAEMMKDTKDRIWLLGEETNAIGLVGLAAKEYAFQTELENEARSKGIDLSKENRQAEVDLAAAKLASAAQAKENRQAYQNEIDNIREQNENLAAQIKTIGMSEAATAAFMYQRKLLNDEIFRGIVYTNKEKQQLTDAHAQYVQLTEQLKKQREQFEFNKSTARGFLSDLKSGLSEGKSLWESWGNAVMRVLDRIIDKLLDDLVNAVFQANKSGSGGGGLLGAIGNLIGIGGGLSSGGIARSNQTVGQTISENPGLFAKGGVFTNSVVNRPTSFFAKGGTPGVMGEAGPEAIMPLKRGPDGSLGVEMYGANSGGAQPVTVHVIPSAYFDVVVDDRAAKVAQPMVVQGSVAATRVSEQDAARKSRRRLV